jgi:RNA polymerase sigma-70 factor (ECF subfamily)
MNTQRIDSQMPSGVVDAGTLFRAHASFVTGFLMHMGVGRMDVDDLVQTVFLIAHRRGGYVPGAARPTTWLAEIALRVAWKHRRTRARHPEEPDGERMEHMLAFGASPEEAAETAQSLRRVERALDGIDLDRRAIFVLFELEGESCNAIAEALGLPLTTIYSRLHTARGEFTRAYNRLAAAERRSTDLPPGARP